MGLAIAGLTEEQAQHRSEGVGSSDVPAIVGLSPYRTPADVYAEKIGLIPPFEGNLKTRLGNVGEESLARIYADDNGLRISKPDTAVHPEHSWALAHADFVVEGQSRLIEVKTLSPRMAHHWEEGLPRWVEAQARWQQFVLNADRVTVVALCWGDDEYRTFDLERDKNYEHFLFTEARSFWFDHVLPAIPPAIDGSEGASELLKALYPRDTAPVLPRTEEASTLVTALREAKQHFDAAEEAKKLAENRVKAFLGNASGIDGLVTWKATKPGIKIDWEAVAREAKAPADLISKFTSERGSSRRLLLKGE